MNYLRPHRLPPYLFNRIAERSRNELHPSVDDFSQLRCRYPVETHFHRIDFYLHFIILVNYVLLARSFELSRQIERAYNVIYSPMN